MHWTDGSEVFPCFGGWLRNRNGKEVCHEMQHGNVQVMTSEMFHENRNHILSQVKVTLRISASQDINICLFERYPLVNKHSNGKPPFSIGNTSSNGGCSIAMLDYQSVSWEYHVKCYFNAGSLVPLLFRLTSVAVSESALAEQENSLGVFGWLDFVLDFWVLFLVWGG